MAITGFATRAGIAKAGGAGNYVQGMDSATELLSFLQHLGGDIAGCVLPAKRRTEGTANNAEIVDYLAKPLNGPERNIAPTKEDHEEAAKTIKTIIIAKLQMISKSGKTYKRWDEARAAQFRASGKKEANKIAALALRKAGAAMKAKMLERAESGGYDAVSEPYATRRQNKYGVPKSAVFKATGQLLSNITDGHIKLIKKPELLKLISGGIESLLGL